MNLKTSKCDDFTPFSTNSELNVVAEEVILWIYSDYTHACVKLPSYQSLSNLQTKLNAETHDKEWMFCLPLLPLITLCLE